MEDYHVSLHLLIQEFDEGYLGEALPFPEVRLFHTDPDKLATSLLRHSSRTVRDLAPGDLHKRHAVTDLSPKQVDLVLEPPKTSNTWQTPLKLRFHYVAWHPSERAYVAHVPVLNIEVVAPTEDALEPLVLEHIRFALLRRDIAKPCLDLLQVQRTRVLHVRKEPHDDQAATELSIQTPKQRVIKAASGDQSERSILKDVCRHLSDPQHIATMPPAFELETASKRIADALLANPPLSVLVVGRSGVGKTAAIHELVRQRERLGLELRRFYETSGSRLVAGMSGFGMWQQRCMQLVRELDKIKGILVLGNLVELMEVGKGGSNLQGIALFLKPYIIRGEILCIAECTEDQLTIIEAQDAHLLEAFRRVDLSPPSDDRAARILQAVARDACTRHGVTLTDDGVDAVIRLHGRYATYSAQPGRPIRFLRNLIRDSKAKGSIDAARVAQAFSAETGLPPFMLDDTVPLDLESTRRWFSDRVIGQSSAVNEVVDVLGRVKAKLTRPGRPIASFLFIGPTGVGKTEMAKTLAEFLYSDRDRIVRIDMSEFGYPEAGMRLIGGDGSKEGLLTAKIREQPFAVVLLDEFEKADPSVFDLLLQVLGEGRLTDARGQLANFTNAVIIMTSNLGAASFRQGPSMFAPRGGDAEASAVHFTEAVRSFLRPEMFNRIDTIVPFAPMDEDTAIRVTRREIELALKRDGIYMRGLELEVPDEIGLHLARKGFDPRYGARPLKRAIERYLLVPLAKAVNGYGDDLALRADVCLKDDSLSVQVRAMLDDAGQPLYRNRLERSVMSVVTQAQDLRRILQKTSICSAVLDYRNKLFQLDRRSRRQARSEHSATAAKPPNDSPDRLRLTDVFRRFDELLEEGTTLEEEALMCVLERAPNDAVVLSPHLDTLRSRWDGWVLDLYCLEYSSPDEVQIAVYGKERKYMFLLAEAYMLALQSASGVQVFALRNIRGELHRDLLPGSRMRLGTGDADILGLIIRCKAPRVRARFGGEAGSHSFIGDSKDQRCYVEIVTGALKDYRPPSDILRGRWTASRTSVRRKYNVDRRRFEDSLYETTESWSSDRLGDAIVAVCDREIRKRALELIE
ncbi:MAG: AAA family ATPase [Actinomycetota bacterium]|nr:AAA family ATPase [Actinomycetota bacterium]